jgi:hypothetical protein
MAGQASPHHLGPPRSCLASTLWLSCPSYISVSPSLARCCTFSAIHRASSGPKAPRGAWLGLVTPTGGRAHRDFLTQDVLCPSPHRATSSSNYVFATPVLAYCFCIHFGGAGDGVQGLCSYQAKTYPPLPGCDKGQTKALSQSLYLCK